MKFVTKIKKKVKGAKDRAELIKKGLALRKDSSLLDLINFLEDAAPLLKETENIEVQVHKNQKTPNGKLWDAIVLVKQHEPRNKQ